MDSSGAESNGGRELAAFAALPGAPGGMLSRAGPADRYADVTPYAGTRLAAPGCRPLNASLLPGGIIAAQAPLCPPAGGDAEADGRCTAAEHYRLLAHRRVAITVALVKFAQPGSRGRAPPGFAERYFPRAGETAVFSGPPAGPVEVSCTRTAVLGGPPAAGWDGPTPPPVRLSWLRVRLARGGEFSGGGFEHIVVHDASWPDGGIPAPGALARLARTAARFRQRAVASGYSPEILVHCSAGVGRTGAFAAFFAAVAALVGQPAPPGPLVAPLVGELRLARPFMVSNAAQFAAVLRELQAWRRSYAALPAPWDEVFARPRPASPDLRPLTAGEDREAASPDHEDRLTAPAPKAEGEGQDEPDDGPR